MSPSAERNDCGNLENIYGDNRVAFECKNKKILARRVFSHGKSQHVV
jgi:hypothetical protein